MYYSENLEKKNLQYEEFPLGRASFPFFLITVHFKVCSLLPVSAAITNYDY